MTDQVRDGRQLMNQPEEWWIVTKRATTYLTPHVITAMLIKTLRWPRSQELVRDLLAGCEPERTGEQPV